MNKKERQKRVRVKLKTRSNRPRLSVFVSNQHIYAQIIDDKKGETLAFCKDAEVEKVGRSVDIARKVGELLGKKAKKKNVKEVVFDRGNKPYHGRIQALAEGARSVGLEF